MNHNRFTSKIGEIGIIDDGKNIVEIQLHSQLDFSINKSNLFLEAKKQIEHFLDHKLKVFTLPYLIQGSDFEKRVLQAMSTIPYGETISYKELAIISKHPLSYRAVGSVCRKNKLPLLLPCHRVIKHNKELGNFAGGIELKKQLIDLEKS
ncbi:MAG: methylated-DNA--[protein]-cysteine S-methyltransferase [Firmicutes bacterium]|nr:methylated-DNA--[protein]-cysteine S-methyltransferase [Bacillota bacterium]